MSSPQIASPRDSGERDQRSAPPAPRKPAVAAIVHRAAHAFMAAGSRILNPLTVRLAGRRGVPLLVVLQHRGRRSGRAYTTPVVARPTADGFVIPLTFGERADWFRNLRAAGGYALRWNGADYALVAPERVDWPAARPAFHVPERLLLPLFGIDQFVRLRRAPASGGEPPSSLSACAENE